jgi:hypothetical protein
MFAGWTVSQHGPGAPDDRFTAWTAAMAALPRRQTRVVTWPAVTVFGFLAHRDVISFDAQRDGNAAMRRYNSGHTIAGNGRSRES